MPGKLFKTIAAGGSATKEFFVPCTYATGGSVIFYGDYPVGRLAVHNDVVRISFRIPHDYNSIVVASIVVIPRSTQASANWDIYSDYAQTGEDYQTHTGFNTSSTYNVTADQIFEVDIAGILTNLTANDMVGVKIGLLDSDHDADVLGVRFKYL